MAILFGLILLVLHPVIGAAECDREEGLEQRLLRHEGYRECPYQDTLGYWTIGVGHRLRPPVDITHCWTRAHVMEVLGHDIERAATAARHLVHSWYRIAAYRQDVLTELSFQLGAHGLSGFRRMLAAVERDDWVGVRRELLDSRLARQTPGRAQEVACRLSVDSDSQG